VINFLIIAFIVFLLVKAVNKVIRHNDQQQPAGPSAEDYLKEIRDLLKEKSN